MKKIKPICICKVCSKEFIAGAGCTGQFCSQTCSRIGQVYQKGLKEKTKLKILEYNLNPNKCLECNKNLDYHHMYNKFCNRLCAALTNSRKKIITKLCLNCQATISYNKRYCNHKCQQSYTWKIKKQKIEQGIIDCNKRYLLELRGHKCECCKNSEWLNKPITIEMDHIDGNHTNNKIDNLKLLCPNCHSMTPTYKAKNKGNGRFFRSQRYREGKSH